MPKLIDHQNKKQSIAEAAWRVVLKHGWEGMTVRNIAKEAGLSLGSLRYYFSTQEELYRYAKELVHKRLAERIDEIFKEDISPKVKIIRVLLELIPVGGELTLETEARLIFKLHLRHEEKGFDMQQDSVYAAVKNVMSNLVLLNLLNREADLNLETERLYALMDGMALDAMLRKREGKIEMAQKMIIAHLNSICKEEMEAEL